MTTAHDLIRELQGDPALAAEVRAALLGDELLALPSSFERLAAAEARAAESFQGTQEALQTLTERVDQLTERVDRLTENVQALTERVDQLTREFYNFRREVAAEFARVHADTGELRGEFRDFRSEMGRMREMWGATEEDEAEDGLLDALEAMGYRIDGKPTNVKLDAHEFDVVVRATTPAGDQVTALAEAKIRLGAADVSRFAARLRNPTVRSELTDAGFGGPWLAYVYGMRIDQRVAEVAKEAGLGLLGARGGPARVVAEPIYQ